MSYINGYFDRSQDIIRVVERDNGKRIFREYPVKYTFYYEDSRGKHKSVDGKTLSRIVCKNTKDFHKELAINRNKNLYESDINPIFQCLSENYINADAPKLKIAFFDIEADFDPEKGFALPSDPFMPVTAISVHLNWLDSLVTFALKPKNMSIERAKESVKDFENVTIYEHESQLLTAFLDIIEDVDVLSGWNSEGYDLPYLINRISKIMSKDDTRRFCLWKQLPKKREFDRFGRTQETYDLIGRVHLDSLELYRKYTYEERHSYRLDAIGEWEIGEKKTVYEGSLDQLYNEDFAKFIEYNRQDVSLLNKLDKKLRLISLTNELAHQNTVLLQTTLGAVAVTEQAIINEAHKRGVQVPNRIKREPHSTESAAGAYVAFPKKGLHNWIGAMDIKSLYPSVIRALNMAPECIVGQLKPESTDAFIDEQMSLQKKSFASAWEGQFGSLEYEAVMSQRKDFNITVDWEDGKSETMSGAQIYKLIFDSNASLMLSANGTIFTSDFTGVIPGLLKKWYAERQHLQEMKQKAVDANNEAEIGFWDRRQLVKKINLNSLYGAILNPGCRFFDKRIGQSTTLSGRQITKHMAAKINEVTTGAYDHLGKAIIYGDTDSAYFSAHPILKKEIETGKIPWNKESVIKLYDKVAEEVNTSFKDFMLEAFHCPKNRGDVIEAGKESVAETGLFITKKRYAVLNYEVEGTRLDHDNPGKVKAMGLDLKRSDTPVFVQDFLSELLLMVLTKKTEKEVLERITEFRISFKQRPGWEKGSPKRVNNLVEYVRKENRQGKANMPGHVRASMNWNNLKRMHGDKHSMEIVDGMKVIVCKLKKNPLEYTSVAYPTDQLRIPKWFKELPFDGDAMESTLIDNKLGNLLGELNWDIQSTLQDNTFSSMFEFE